MSSDAHPALMHIRRMELRIEQQMLSIERLEQIGEDTAAAVQRLRLLRHALDEMRVQLGPLSPAHADDRRPPIDAIRLRL